MPEKTKKDVPVFEPALIEATSENALSALESTGAGAEALIEAWVRAGNVAAVACAAERGTGPARKAARRGINVLRARGIKAELPPRVASLSGRSAEETVTEAWLIPPDPSGTTLIVIAERSVTRRSESAFFYLHESVGVRSVSVGTLSGSQLKDALKRAADMGFEPVRVPVPYARYRVAEARRELKEKGLPEPLGMTTAQILLEPVPEPQPHPLDAEGLALADEDAKELAARSGLLHGLPEFRGWLPPREAVDELLAEVGKQLTPGEEPDGAVIQKALDEALNAATDRYFAPERRAGLVRLLKDSALSVLSTHGEVRALEVVATMQRIESAGLITDPPHELPFLRVFFEKAVAALAFQGGGKLQVPIEQGRPATAPDTLTA